jgi:hypothetical protein
MNARVVYLGAIINIYLIWQAYGGPDFYPFDLDAAATYFYAVTGTNAGPNTNVERLKIAAPATVINPLATLPNGFAATGIAALFLRGDGYLYTVDPLFNLVQIG